MLKDGCNKFNSKSGCVIFAHNHIHLSLLCTWYLFICNGVMTSLIPRLFLLCCALSTPQHQLPMVPMLNVWSHVVTAPVWSLVHISHSDEHQIQYSDLKCTQHSRLGESSKQSCLAFLFSKHVSLLSFSKHLFEGLEALNLCFLVYWVPNNDIRIGCYFSEVQPRTHNHVQL